jgi:PadR family transcriptional regulator, regulatory protein PadR
MNAPLTKPLPALRFYILLALSREELYGYAVKARIGSHSLGTVKAKDGTLYPLLKKMTYEGLIEEAGHQPVGDLDKDRLHYRLTAEGRYRLECDLKRLRHAVNIGETAGYFNDELPPDIQRLLEQLK